MELSELLVSCVAAFTGRAQVLVQQFSTLPYFTTSFLFNYYTQQDGIRYQEHYTTFTLYMHTLWVWWSIVLSSYIMRHKVHNASTHAKKGNL